MDDDGYSAAAIVPFTHECMDHVGLLANLTSGGAKLSAQTANDALIRTWKTLSKDCAKECPDRDAIVPDEESSGISARAPGNVAYGACLWKSDRRYSYHAQDSTKLPHFCLMYSVQVRLPAAAASGARSVSRAMSVHDIVREIRQKRGPDFVPACGVRIATASIESALLMKASVRSLK